MVVQFAWGAVKFILAFLLLSIGVLVLLLLFAGGDALAEACPQILNGNPVQVCEDLAARF